MDNKRRIRRSEKTDVNLSFLCGLTFNIRLNWSMRERSCWKQQHPSFILWPFISSSCLGNTSEWVDLMIQRRSFTYCNLTSFSCSGSSSLGSDPPLPRLRWLPSPRRAAARNWTRHTGCQHCCLEPLGWLWLWRRRPTSGSLPWGWSPRRRGYQWTHWWWTWRRAERKTIRQSSGQRAQRSQDCNERERKGEWMEGGV